MRSFVFARVPTPCPRICQSTSRLLGLTSESTSTRSISSCRWATSSRAPRFWRWQRNWKWYNGGPSQHHSGLSSSRSILGHNASLATTATFVALSGEDDDASDKTGEERMLEASRAEISKQISDDEQGLPRLGHKIVLFLDLYVWEPLCTGVRFLHLALIFVPVLLAIPAIWVGRRQQNRDNERSGTLWWYGFLVQSMEWAGPAFIKVRAAGGSPRTFVPHSSTPQHSSLSTRDFCDGSIS